MTASTAEALDTTLRDIWDHLATWMQVSGAGDIGSYPTDQIALGIGSPEATIEIATLDVDPAQQAWEGFAAGDPAMLQDSHLAHVLEDLGYLAGCRLGLDFARAAYFGDWVAKAITGQGGSPGNVGAVEQLDAVAGQAAYGDPALAARGFTTPDFWEQYRVAVAAVIEALRGGPDL